MLLKWASNKKRKLALAKSSVKIRAHDVVASNKILFGVPLVFLASNLTNLYFYFKYSWKLASSIWLRFFLTGCFCFLFNFYIISNPPCDLQP
jgi:hypothetical protein